MVAQKFENDNDLLRRVSLVDEAGERRVRMAYLAVVASHKVNGVSELHSELMKESIFADFARIFPERFTNVTNGITPRRWLSQANPFLSELIDDRIGKNWRRHFEEIGRLKPWKFQGGQTPEQATAGTLGQKCIEREPESGFTFRCPDQTYP